MKAIARSSGSVGVKEWVDRAPGMSKVPAVTAIFWLIKVMSTTVGETVADFLAVRAGLGTAVTAGITLVLLAGALAIQLRSERYVPWIYWLTVVLVSIVGTQITDAMTDSLQIDLWFSTGAFAVLLTAIFLIWYVNEKTLSIQSITTRRREYFYWAAILFTFALGTAAGDLATEAFGLGFRLGVLIFGALIAIVVVAWRFGLNSIIAFWAAYILTRPLGAALGDLLSQARTYGGLGWGALATSALFLAVIVGLVAYATSSLHKASKRNPRRAH